MTPPILQLFRTPDSARSWGVSEWADTMPRLAQSGLTAHAAALVARAGLGRNDVPAGVLRQFAASTIASDAQLRSLRWEVNEVLRTLQGKGIRAVPLKGADYLIRGATPALGRTVNDLDLLVAREQIEATREAFTAAGWEFGDAPIGPHDHQLPVVTHIQRKTQLELHWQLVAEGGTVGFKIATVLDEAELLQDGVLALLRVEDTVLACVGHFIRNSRSFSAFRDLLDLRELIADFNGKDAGFGGSLIARAEEIGLGAALSLAVRDSTTLFGDVASPALAAWAEKRRPSFAGGSAMALVPDGCASPTFVNRLSRVGRMFARMRSAYPPGKTLYVGLRVLQGKES